MIAGALEIPGRGVPGGGGPDRKSAALSSGTYEPEIYIFYNIGNG